MKKKSVSRLAFLEPRILIGLFIVLAGVLLALLGLGAFSASAASSAKVQQKYNPTISSIDLSVLPPGFDCYKINELGIDKQENLRAGLIMIACGLAEGGSPSSGSGSLGNRLSQWIQKLLPEPLFIGGTDLDVILPDGAYPHVNQSESMEWGGPNNTWVVNYNDSRTAPSCYSGISYSTDNGATWHASSALSSGHGTNFGDPIVVYNPRLGMWFAGDLASGCGGLTVRQNVMYRSTNGGVTWTSTNAGPGFQGPGRSNPSYFACMFNNGINMWRHMGWGEPAANGNVVSLDYAACGQPTYCANA